MIAPLPTTYPEMIIQAASILFDLNKKLVIVGFFPILTLIYLCLRNSTPKSRTIAHLLIATYLFLSSLLVISVLIGFAALSVSPRWMGSEILC
ncbi:MAG: hypothetical protein RLY61_540 [Candidatus Parcubacteria bacterium]|jgi:hypothetical protein